MLPRISDSAFGCQATAPRSREVYYLFSVKQSWDVLRLTSPKTSPKLLCSLCLCSTVPVLPAVDFTALKEEEAFFSILHPFSEEVVFLYGSDSEKGHRDSGCHYPARQAQSERRVADLFTNRPTTRDQHLVSWKVFGIRKDYGESISLL